MASHHVIERFKPYELRDLIALTEKKYEWISERMAKITQRIDEDSGSNYAEIVLSHEEEQRARANFPHGNKRITTGVLKADSISRFADKNRNVFLAVSGYPLCKNQQPLLGGITEKDLKRIEKVRKRIFVPSQPTTKKSEAKPSIFENRAIAKPNMTYTKSEKLSSINPTETKQPPSRSETRSLATRPYSAAAPTAKPSSALLLSRPPTVQTLREAPRFKVARKLHRTLSSSAQRVHRADS